MAKGQGWKTLITAETRMTGPSKAILAEAKKLKDKGIAYEVVPYNPTRFTEELETRESDEANDESADK